MMLPRKLGWIRGRLDRALLRRLRGGGRGQGRRGFRLDLTGRVAIFADFAGEFAAEAQTYSGNGGIRIAW